MHAPHRMQIVLTASRRALTLRQASDVIATRQSRLMSVRKDRSHSSNIASRTAAAAER